MENTQKCELCGEPMPPGEEMFKFHGYSGNCPKPPIGGHVEPKQLNRDDKLVAAVELLNSIVEKARLHTDVSRVLVENALNAPHEEKTDRYEKALTDIVKLTGRTRGNEIARAALNLKL